MSDEVCIYCGIPKSKATSTCKLGELEYEHVYVTLEKFAESSKQTWVEWATKQHPEWLP